MNILGEPKIVFQEVPDHISICFQVTGCHLRCDGCHSPEMWDYKNGSLLDIKRYLDILRKYKGYADCVLFMGGDNWVGSQRLSEYCQIAQKEGFKTCLYSGYDEVQPYIRKYLNFQKTGRYIKERGGLDKPDTNQKFINLDTGE